MSSSNVGDCQRVGDGRPSVWPRRGSPWRILGARSDCGISREPVRRLDGGGRCGSPCRIEPVAARGLTVRPARWIRPRGQEFRARPVAATGRQPQHAQARLRAPMRTADAGRSAESQGDAFLARAATATSRKTWTRSRTAPAAAWPLLSRRARTPARATGPIGRSGAGCPAKCAAPDLAFQRSACSRVTLAQQRLRTVGRSPAAFVHDAPLYLDSRFSIFMEWHCPNSGAKPDSRGPSTFLWLRGRCEP